MKTRSTNHPWPRHFSVQGVHFILAFLFFLHIQRTGASSGDHLWTCPTLNNLNTVTCWCDLPHSLQCHNTNVTTGTGSDEAALATIVAGLRILPANNRVQVLQLQLDQLFDIPEGIFDSTSLQALVIGRSHVTQLKPEALRGLSKSLIALAVTSGILTSVPTAALARVALLTKLDLSGNIIQELGADDFRLLVNLQEVNLAGNRIAEASVFANNRDLRKLILDRNRLSGVGGIGTLKSSGAKIHDTPFPALRHLSLARNLYKGVFRSEFLPKMPALERLSLAFNQLVLMDTGSFASCTNLQFLDLSHNEIAVLKSEVFSGLNHLSVLDLSHNRLVGSLPSNTFAGLASLTTLSLNDNYLKYIDDGLFNPLVSIRSIDLKDNSIGFVHHLAFVNSNGLRMLDLEDNPLSCDCKLKAFAAWLRKTPNVSEDQKRLATCSVPNNLRDQMLIDVPTHSFTCSDNHIPPESFTRMEREEKEAALRRAQNNPIPNRFDAIDDSGLQLLNYTYQEGVLTLDWVVAAELLPIKCDAVFIFEQHEKQRLRLRNKIPTSCDQSADIIDDVPDPGRPTTIKLSEMSFRSHTKYQVCLAVIHFRMLVLGCSELLRLDPDSNILIADNPQEFDRSHHNTKTTPEYDEDIDSKIDEETRDGDHILRELDGDEVQRKDDSGHRREKQDSRRNNAKQDGDHQTNNKDGDRETKNKDANHETKNKDGNHRAENNDPLSPSMQDDDRKRNKQNGSHKANQEDDDLNENKQNTPNDPTKNKQNSDHNTNRQYGNHRTKQNGDQRSLQQNINDFELPSIFVNTSTSTSVTVSWQFTSDHPLPEFCELHIRVMLREMEVDRKRAVCGDATTVPHAITFSGLNFQLHDYRICAQFDEGRGSEISRNQKKECVPLSHTSKGGHKYPGALVTFAIITAFLAFSVLVAVLIYQLGKRLCGNRPKTTRLVQAYRGSTQYRVFYNHPMSEQPLVTSTA